MNKKGFTLIELIAVIVILAIILLIAVPKVLTIIETSRKNSLLSGTKIIAKAIQSDSLSTSKRYYLLDSDGKLYRCTSEEEPTCDKNNPIKYEGKLISQDGNSVIFVKNEDGTVELKTGGTICDKTKKYCITAGGDLDLRSVKIEDVKPPIAQTSTLSNTNTTTSSEENTIVVSGNITKYGTSGSVTYTLYSNGRLVINGTGDAIMEDYTMDDVVEQQTFSQAINIQAFKSEVNRYILEGMIPDEDFYMTFYYAYISGVRTIEAFISFIDQVDETMTIEEITQVVNEMATAYFGENANNIFSILNPKTPETLEIIGVKEIGDFAFPMNNFQNINIPSSVRSVGLGSFIYSTNITSLTLADGLLELGDGAFQYSNKLSSVSFPSSLESIGRYAFDNCNLSSIIIPNTISEIKLFAFSNNQLTSVTIPNSITSIGSNAFYNNQLTSVTIPNSVTSIGSNAFYNNQLTSVTIPSSITSIGSTVFCNNKLTSLIIPSNIKSIGYSSFADNQLTSLTIGSNVSSIDSYAFSNNLLTNIIIPSNVTDIQYGAFQSNPITNVTIQGEYPTRFNGGWTVIGFPAELMPQ